MGKPRFLLVGVIAALCLAGCGGGEPLLQHEDVEAWILEAGGDAGGGKRYGPKSMEEGVRSVLEGRVNFQGNPFKVRKLQLSDQFCIDSHPQGILGEDFLMSEDGSMAGVIVYVKRGLNKESWPVPTEAVVLDQKGCQYIPHLAVIQTGQPLVIKSSDNTMHNVHGAQGPNPEFNKSMASPGTLPPRTFSKMEVPKRISCDVHGWMESFVAILPHPCHAITGEDGRFRIEGVPPGEYQLAFWHERLGEHTLDLTVGESETLECNHTYTR